MDFEVPLLSVSIGIRPMPTKLAIKMFAKRIQNCLSNEFSANIRYPFLSFPCLGGSAKFKCEEFLSQRVAFSSTLFTCGYFKQFFFDFSPLFAK